jgi:hypothetical protein
MTLISKTNAGLLNVAGAVGVMMLSSTIAWAECDFLKEGDTGLPYNPAFVHMSSDPACAGNGVCCQILCQSQCGSLVIITCADPTQCHPMARAICDGTTTCA